MTTVKLSVHKNNAEQRRRKQLRRSAVRDIKVCVESPDIAGYCVFAWDKDASTRVGWYCDKNSPLSIDDVPLKLNKTILRRQVEMDRED